MKYQTALSLKLVLPHPVHTILLTMILRTKGTRISLPLKGPSKGLLVTMECVLDLTSLKRERKICHSLKIWGNT